MKAAEHCGDSDGRSGAVLTLRATASDADRIGDAVAAWWGCPVAESRGPDGDRVELDVYFGTRVEAELAGRALPAEWACAWSVRSYQAEDWTESWKRHFHAMDIGDRLRVVPPWLSSRDSARIEIVINPGLSFGTGQHFTTRFCLEQIERLLGIFPGATVLDVGTGSGILAITAVRLGARCVTGVDSDPVCLDQARKNAANNRAADRMNFGCRDITEGWPGGRYDIVCANLYGGLLMDLAPALLTIARKRLVLSGIGTREIEAVASAFRRAGGVEDVRAHDHEWAGLVFRPVGRGKAAQRARR